MSDAQIHLLIEKVSARVEGLSATHRSRVAMVANFIMGVRVSGRKGSGKWEVKVRVSEAFFI